MLTEKYWKKTAEDQQNQYAKYFPGSRMNIYSMSVLKTLIAVCSCGVPDKVPCGETLSYKHYTKKQQQIIENISQCILKNQKKPDEEKIHTSLILVIGRTKDKNNAHFEECVFKVPGKNSTNFIDKNCRVYKDWSNYLEKNTLPEASICYPINGEYEGMEYGVSVEFKDTPSCHVKRKVLSVFDKLTGITGFLAGGVGLLSLFVPVVAPLIWTAFGVQAVAALYGSGRGIENLVDRSKHNQTLSPLNSEARSAWLGSTVPIIGIAAGGATAVAAAAKVSNLGITLTQPIRTAIKVTNGIHVAARGVDASDRTYGKIETKLNGEVTVMKPFSQDCY